MLNHSRMGKLAGWRPRGYHERARESCTWYESSYKYKRWDRDLPFGLSARRKNKSVHRVKHAYHVVCFFSRPNVSILHQVPEGAHAYICPTSPASPPFDISDAGSHSGHPPPPTPPPGHASIAIGGRIQHFLSLLDSRKKSA